MNTNKHRRKQPKTVGCSTNLLVACANGDLQVIKSILSDVRLRRIENSRRDNQKWSALHHAIKCGDIECLRAMLASPYVPVFAKTFEGQTVLHLAVSLPDTRAELVELLLGKHPALVDSLNNEEESALQKAIVMGREDLARLIIKLGRANVNHVDLNHEHALFYAVRSQQYSMVEYLLEETDCCVTIKNDKKMDVISIDLGLNNNVKNDIQTKCLKIMFERMYASGQSIRTIFYPINNCILLENEEIMEWLLQRFFIDPNVNNPFYADLVDRICAIPTLKLSSKLAICYPLHESINPIDDGYISKSHCRRFGSHMRKRNRFVLYCMFTVMVDDPVLYLECLKSWWKFYIPSATDEQHVADVIDVITIDSNPRANLPKLLEKVRSHTSKQYLQFIKHLSVDLTTTVIRLECLFEKYIWTVANESSHKFNREIMAALLMYVTSASPYEFLCSDPENRKKCNTIFRDTGDIYQDVLTYRSIALKGDFLNSQPNTLFNLARTSVRAAVLSNATPNPTVPDVMKLLRLEVPLVIRRALIYQYTRFATART